MVKRDGVILEKNSLILRKSRWVFEKSLIKAKGKTDGFLKAPSQSIAK